VDFSVIDIIVFFGFMIFVMAVSLFAGRNEKNSEDYFLAGRKLTWGLIGFSLIASNISTEHFVGMAGTAFGRIGLAVANWEWMSAVCMVFIAWWLLPRFIRSGIYTMPQFLEFRYDSTTRTIMSSYHLIAYIVALLSTVLYSGAVAIDAIFDVSGLLVDYWGIAPEKAAFWANVVGIWCIGITASLYTIYGGLKAVVWSDLFQGGALLIGGGIVAVLGVKMLGGNEWSGVGHGWTLFRDVNAEKLHVFLPMNDNYAPWVGTMIGGLWILNLHYWGLNQFITQRTLGAKSLAEGQMGVILGASLKLIIPFIIVIPGIIAFQLYGDKITNGDMAYPYMITQLLPPYLRGVMFAALCGAVMSTFNSGLNSAATIFTIDIYSKYINKNASPLKQVKTGRWVTAIIAVVACTWAPIIYYFEGVFSYIQEMWSFIAGGIVAAFLIGLIVKKAPPAAAKGALILGPILYALCRYTGTIFGMLGMEKIAPDIINALAKFNGWSFLYHQMIVFAILVVYMLIVTYLKPLKEPVKMPVNEEIDIAVPLKVYIFGCVVIAVTVGLYIYFW
jgi:solute:Na+ symporter, SSS family